MEQSYHLEPYRTDYANDYNPTTYSNQPDSYRRSLSPTFRIPRKAVASLDTTQSDYTTLVDSFSDSAAKKPTKRSKISVLRWWIPEIIASVVSVGSLLGIAFFLRAYDGVSIDDIQLPYSLSINGVVALLATVNRVALMIPIGSGLSQEIWLWFSTTDRAGKTRGRRLRDLSRSDDASRGAWGSLKLMLFYPGRWLALIGAFVTIVSLGFGTFTQQLIAITQAPAIYNSSLGLGPGNILRAESFVYSSGQPYEVQSTLPSDVKALLYDGILNSQVNPVTTYCPTGNCTWPITPSLAVCGHCAPTTFKSDCEEPNYSSETCSFTTASGASVQLGQPETNPSLGFQVVSSGNLSKTDKWYISQIDMLGAPSGTFDFWTVSDIHASSCQLWFCVNAYNISVYNSNQSQTITQSFHEFEASNHFYNDEGPGGGYSAGKQFLPLPSAMNPVPGVVYGMDTLSAGGFSDEFQSLVFGFVTIDQSSSSADNDFVQAIWENSGNPDPWIQRVALSLTNSLRSGGARGLEYRPHDRYNGTAYHTVFIIRWYWIILPSTMVVLSLLFLVIVITKTARSDIVSWKGSPLTFLLFSVDASIKEAAAGTADLNGGFEDAVGHRTVVLSGDAGGFRRFRDV